MKSKLFLLLALLLAGFAGTARAQTLTLNPQQLTLTVGAVSQMIHADAIGVGDFQWTSSNTGVVTVTGDAYGDSHSITVTPTGVGTATITVTATDKYGETYSATCAVTVNNNFLIRGEGTVAVGNTLSLGTINAPTGYSVAWTSSNPNVATVAGSTGNSYATVTGVSAGTATITATVGTGTSAQTATCTITVEPRGIHPESALSAIVNGSIQTVIEAAGGGTPIWYSFTAQAGKEYLIQGLDYAICNFADAITFYSADMKTISNSASGCNISSMPFTASQSGTSYIKFMIRSSSGTFGWTLTESTPTFTLNPSQTSVAVGGTAEIVAYNVPAGYTVNWTSSNPNVASVAAGTGLNADGRPYATVTGVDVSAELGTATITAIFYENGIAKQATCTVTVTDTDGSPQTYTVTFDAMNYAANPQPIKVQAGNSINLPAVSNANYTFMGWYDNVNFTNGVADFSAAKQWTANDKVTRNVKLYAKWEQQTQNTFVISPSQVNVAVGDTQTLSALLNNSQVQATWTSSNPNVASVGATSIGATVTAVSAGTAIIKASIGNQVDGSYKETTCIVTVASQSLPAPTNLRATVYPNYVKMEWFSEKYNVIVEITNTTTNQSYQWEVLEGNTFTKELPAGTYNWSVAAIDGSQMSAYTVGEPFTVGSNNVFAINPAQASVAVGGTITLHIIAHSDAPITWTSSAPNIASVTGITGPLTNTYTSATVTGLIAMPNPVTITASIGSAANGDYQEATCTVTVTAAQIPSLTGVKLNKREITVTQGKNEYISFNVSPANAEYTYQWASTNPNVVAVSNGGLEAGRQTLITAGNTGTENITITVTDKNNGTLIFSDVCEVTVVPGTTEIPVSGVTITPAALSLKEKQSMRLTATVLPASASNYMINWTSSNPNVVEIMPNNNGYIKAVGAGTATITATVNRQGINYQATCEVTVEAVQPDYKVALSKANLSLKPDASEQLEVVIAPVTENYMVAYTSTNPEIAEVLADGTVLAHETGTASVLATVTVGNATYTATCAVYVETRAVVIEETATVGQDGVGTTEVAMEIPSGVLFSGSFKVEIPEGVSIDVLATQLAESLNQNMELTVTQIPGTNIWVFTITIRQSALKSGKLRATRSTTEYEMAKIIDIVYIVDNTVADGDYDLSISGLELTFDDEDGTVIARDETVVPISVAKNITGVVAPVIESKNVQPRYFNLQGIETAKPVKGNIYIVKEGNTARKIMVRE